MKKLLYIWLIIFTTYGCDDYLITEPQNMLSADVVFSDIASVEGFMATLYAQMPMQDFQFGKWSYVDPMEGGSGLPGTSNFQGNYIHEMLQKKTYLGTDGDGGMEEEWSKMYLAIGNVNNFLFEIEAARDILSEDEYHAYRAEAIFIRCFTYNELVRAFGGVPLILETPDYDGTNSSLWVERDSEEAVYDQLIADLDYCITNLPETNDYCRANRYAAAALKSRVMLYAASIAKNGTPDRLAGLSEKYPDGLLGVDPSRAEEFYKECISASELIIKSELYELYNKYPEDKAKNYQYLFLSGKDNNEVILARAGDPLVEKHHSHDFLAFTRLHTANYGGRKAPDLNFINMYESVDGYSDKFKNKDNSGNYIIYPTVLDFFKHKDPRFLGSYLLPGEVFRGDTIKGSSGVYHKKKWKAPPKNVFTTYYDPETRSFVDYDTGIIGSGNVGNKNFDDVYTFCFCKKFTDIQHPANTIAIAGGSYTHWFELRYAEVLLNYGEALFELNEDGALAAINEVRRRAGVRELEQSELTLKRIQNERFVELSYENKAFWDYKRHRTLVDAFQPQSFSKNGRYRGGLLRFYWYVEQGGFIAREEFSTTGNIDPYLPKHYYNRIPLSEMNLNPLLVQNPGY